MSNRGSMTGRPDTSEDFNYDSVADRYARRVDSAPYNAFYERPAMLSIVDSLPDIHGRSVLDAGCGTGWYAEQLRARGARVTAVDESRRMLSYARERLGANVDGELVLAAADLSRALPLPSA